MNRKSLIAAAALAGASLSAFAVQTSSTLTREEVKSELRDLKSQGLYQDVKEASPSPLDDQRREQQFSQTYGTDRVAQAIAEHDRDALMSLADRADEAPVIIIEAVPQGESQPTDHGSALPYDHPAVRDGSPSDEAPQVPAQ